MVMPALESVRLGKTRNEAAACLTATVLIAPADTYFLKLSVAVGDVVRLLDDGGKEIFLGSVHELDRTPNSPAIFPAICRPVPAYTPYSSFRVR